MKKILFILVAIFSLSSISIAQNARSSKSSTNNPRSERQIAITTEAGWKSMSGTGINVSYYVIPKLALDAGVGLGWQGLKYGARARYLFMDQEFTPILGLGFNMSPYKAKLAEFEFFEDQTFLLDHDLDPETEPQEVFVDLEINQSYYAQIITGIEWMSQGGFVVAFNIGYRASLNKTLDTTVEYNGETFEIVDQYTDAFINSVTRIYGGGLSTSLHLGYAF